MQALYFIAVITSKEIHQEILQYKTWMKNQYGCRVALRSPAHITLVPPFKMDSSDLSSLIRVLEILAPQNEKFKVEIDGFSNFPPRVIYANVKAQAQLEQLKNSLEHSILQQTQISIRPDQRPFKPHITIASRDIPAGSFESAWKEFKNKPLQADFMAEEISLLIYNPTGWSVVRAFPLGRSESNI